MSRSYPRSTVYRGRGGTMWLAGSQQRAPSVARFFCGDDARPIDQGRVWRARAAARVAEVNAAGGLPILQLPDRTPAFGDLITNAITMPTMVDLHVRLPAKPEQVGDRLRTSTTREDFRRIRRADFHYRISTDPEVLREFHARHYRRLVEQRFPDDGAIGSIESMLRKLEDGGELVCIDVDGEWVAGIYNVSGHDDYTLGSLGIRDADERIRQMRVTSALIVRSLERAVELGHDTASLGRALPFLGKGPIWFKAKWGGMLALGRAPSYMHVFVDLRHAAHREMLASHPPLHVIDDRLVASTWLEANEDSLRRAVREARRYPGIHRWYVLGRPETLAAGADVLAAHDVIVPIPVTETEHHPLWLSRVISDVGGRADGASGSDSVIPPP